nr:hypothetical protein [Quadrisphaera sp. DSM 44207]
MRDEQGGVVLQPPAAVRLDGARDAAQGLGGRLPGGRAALEQVDQPVDPEGHPGRVARPGDAVGVQDQPVVRFQRLLADGQLHRVDAEGRAAAPGEGLDDPAPVQHERGRVGGADVAQAPGVQVQGGQHAGRRRPAAGGPQRVVHGGGLPVQAAPRPPGGAAGADGRGGDQPGVRAGLPGVDDGQERLGLGQRVVEEVPVHVLGRVEHP